MANNEVVMPYVQQWANYLVGEGCRPPVVNAGNRWPTRQEVIAAIEAEGLLAVPHGSEEVIVRPPAGAPEAVEGLLRHVVEVRWDATGALGKAGQSSYLVIFQCRDWDRLGDDDVGLFIHGQNWPLEVFLVHRLAQECGQLVLYPSGGGVPLVVGPDSDPGQLAGLWPEADRREDGCKWLYEQMGC